MSLGKDYSPDAMAPHPSGWQREAERDEVDMASGITGEVSPSVGGRWVGRMKPLVAHHEIFNDVNATLKNLLEVELKQVFKNVMVRVSDLHNLSSGDTKTGVNLFLYEVVLNEQGVKQQEEVAQEEEDPETGEWSVAYYPAPVRLSLRYVITPFASDSATEYRLLGRIIQIFQENPVMSGDKLRGEVLPLYGRLGVVPDPHLRMGAQREIFGAYSERYKLSAGYVARVEMSSSKVLRRTRLVKERRADVRRSGA